MSEARATTPTFLGNSDQPTYVLFGHGDQEHGEVSERAEQRRERCSEREPATGERFMLNPARRTINV